MLLSGLSVLVVKLEHHFKLNTSYLLETPRLQLREFAETDAEILFELNSDPKVLRYTGDEPFATKEAALKFILEYDQYRKFGYGRWAVEIKGSHEMIGWCGLKRQEDGETNLGFRLFKKHWGKGFATEAARACLDYGFYHLGLSCIIGRVLKENLASVRVLEKAGMKNPVEVILHGAPALIYSLGSNEWKNG